MSDASRTSINSSSDSSDSSGYEDDLRADPLSLVDVEPFDGAVQPWRFEPQGPEVVQSNIERGEDQEEEMAPVVHERMGNTDWYYNITFETIYVLTKHFTRC